MQKSKYDTVIIGSGLAGLTAAIYASRYQLLNVVVGKLAGGTINLAHRIENFPGFPGITGIELAQKVIAHAASLGVKVVPDQVTEVRARGDEFTVVTEKGGELEARTVIAATGTERRKLNVPGEREYLGRGVSYCTHCDAPFFKGKTVAVIGGSSSAVTGALHLADFALKVFIIYRKEELRAEPIWVKEVKACPKIEVIYKTNVTEIVGDGTKVTAIKLDNLHQDKESLSLDGVFIEIGGIPVSGFLKTAGVEMDENGYIKVNQEMQTNVLGIFAAGDLTTQSLFFQQAITAAAQGAIAAYSAFRHIKSRR